MVKCLLAMGETQVRSLGREDPLEKEMATHSSILAWRIPWTEVPGSYSPWGCKETRLKRLNTHACRKKRKKAIRLSGISRLGRGEAYKRV